MEDYFAFFGLPRQFYLDESVIKKKYLQKSREFHPDFFTLSENETQEHALAMASLNNKAYQTLKHWDSRIQHILSLEGLLTENTKEQLPPSFLMEMMELNEQVADAKTHPESRKTTNQVITESLIRLDQDTKPIMEAYDAQNDTIVLEKVKEYYFQRKYFLRLKENLDNFASL